MRVRLADVGVVLAGILLLGVTACTGQGLPAILGPSSCGAGPDRCAALNCPMGTHCALTSGCTAFCEQEQLTSH